MAPSEAVAAWKAFLESTPPNVSTNIPQLITQIGDAWWIAPCPRLQLHCRVDGGPRWFDGPGNTVDLRSNWEYEFITYTCRDCGRYGKTFAVLILRKSEEGDVEVMKLGEYPPFAAPISKRIEKLLGEEDLELYRKGMRAEAQGLGIGAATYFRRIVENQWKQLVTEIREAAAKLGIGDLTAFDAALKATQFSKAVDMLKAAIPQKLLILNGENPLTLLYQPLSTGLHGLTDEQCLQQAADIRIVLTALLENIADVLKDQDELKGAASRLKQPRP